MTLEFARPARQAGQTELAEALLADFEARFPDSQALPEALVRWVDLMLATERVAQARATMQRVEASYPEMLDRESVRRLRDRLARRPASGAEGE